VTWRRTGCCDALVLRVYRTAGGWHLETKAFQVSAPEWVDRYEEASGAGLAGVTSTADAIAAHREGRVFFANLREVRGLTRALPAAFADWDAGARFEVGCRHRHAWVELVEVVSDCAEAISTRRSVIRTV